MLCGTPIGAQITFQVFAVNEATDRTNPHGRILFWREDGCFMQREYHTFRIVVLDYLGG